MVIAWPGCRPRYWLLASPTNTFTEEPGSFWITTEMQFWLPRLAAVLVALTWPATGLSPVERDIEASVDQRNLNQTRRRWRSRRRAGSNRTLLHRGTPS